MKLSYAIIEQNAEALGAGVQFLRFLVDVRAQELYVLPRGQTHLAFALALLGVAPAKLFAQPSVAGHLVGGQLELRHGVLTAIIIGPSSLTTGANVRYTREMIEEAFRLVMAFVSDAEVPLAEDLVVKKIF